MSEAEPSSLTEILATAGILRTTQVPCESSWSTTIHPMAPGEWCAIARRDPRVSVLHRIEPAPDDTGTAVNAINECRAEQ